MIVSLLSLTGCSTLFSRSDAANPSAEEGVATAPGKAEYNPESPEMQALQARIQTLESQVQVLSERLSHSGSSLAPQASGVTPHSAEGAGFSVGAESSAIKTYREALLLFQTRKYTEAVLGFSGFLERYADHVLAGGAQFYVAESYAAQGELRLAEQEFQRVLTSYDRSSFVPQSLARLAAVQDQLKRPDDAKRTRARLLALYPASPAAANGGVTLREDVSTRQAAPASKSPEVTPTPLGSSMGGRLDAPPTAPADGSGN